MNAVGRFPAFQTQGPNKCTALGEVGESCPFSLPTILALQNMETRK